MDCHYFFIMTLALLMHCHLTGSEDVHISTNLGKYKPHTNIHLNTKITIFTHNIFIQKSHVKHMPDFIIRYGVQESQPTFTRIWSLQVY